MSAPFTPAQEDRLAVIIREAMIVHSIGFKMSGSVARRHYSLFYGELDARRSELDRASPGERDALLLSIANEAHEQELAERQASERAVDPDRLTVVERFTRTWLGPKS